MWFVRLNFDIIIKNGIIVDGTGNPCYRANIGVRKDKIAKISRYLSDSGATIIEADGEVVCPGFIDIHSHSDMSIMSDRKAEHKIRQGVTTDIVGNCGFSPAPIRENTFEDLKTYISPVAEEGYSWDWSTFGEFYNELESKGSSINLAPLVGHGTIRIAAMGFEAKTPDPNEFETMKSLLTESLEQGALGLSFGLEYAPGIYSKTEEIIELAKIVSHYGGVCTFHIRNEGDFVLEAVTEVLTVGEEANVPVEISHLKAEGRMNWGKVGEAIQLINEARARGIDATFDVYPYTASSTFLTIILPPWSLEGGVHELLKRLKDPGLRQKIRGDIEKGVPSWSSMAKACGTWDNILINYCEKRSECLGKTISQIALMDGKDPYEAIFDLLLEEAGAVSAVFFTMSENDVITALKSPLSMIGSDSVNLSRAKPHPRTYGTFPRVFKKYVDEIKVIGLENAVRKMTSLPAQKLGLYYRGLLMPGFSADLVIFNPSEVADKASYEDPRRYPIGLSHVLVNGQIIFEDGQFIQSYPGKILKRDAG